MTTQQQRDELRKAAEAPKSWKNFPMTIGADKMIALLDDLDAAAEREVALTEELGRRLDDYGNTMQILTQEKKDHAAFKSAATLKIEGLERENARMSARLREYGNFTCPKCGNWERGKHWPGCTIGPEPTADAANNNQPPRQPE